MAGRYPVSVHVIHKHIHFAVSLTQSVDYVRQLQ